MPECRRRNWAFELDLLIEVLNLSIMRLRA